MIVQRDAGPARLALLIAICLVVATGVAGYALVDAAVWFAERR